MGLSIVLSARLLLIAIPKIMHLRDVSMLTKPYATLAVGARVRLHSKEVVSMRRENRIPFDRHPLAMLLGALVFVFVVAVIAILGPGRVFHWLVSFLMPMAVILLVVVGTIGLLAREGGKVLDSRDNPPPTPTNSRSSPRGDGFSKPVYWLLMSLFLLASVAMATFFWLVIRDQWINARPLVAGHFDEGETLQVIFTLLVSVAVSSGLLWRHYRRIDSYGSPLELLFMVVFTLCAALAAAALLPTLFAG
jgi:magnesium-transporting ATPase (P-type)